MFLFCWVLTQKGKWQPELKPLLLHSLVLKIRHQAIASTEFFPVFWSIEESCSTGTSGIRGACVKAPAPGFCGYMEVLLSGENKCVNSQNDKKDKLRLEYGCT